MVDFPSREAITAPFRSTHAFHEFVKAPIQNGDEAVVGNDKWSNRDLEPTPERERTWDW